MVALYSLGPQWAPLPPTAASRATSWLEDRHGPVSMMDSGLGSSHYANVRLDYPTCVCAGGVKGLLLSVCPSVRDKTAL